MVYKKFRHTTRSSNRICIHIDKLKKHGNIEIRLLPQKEANNSRRLPRLLPSDLPNRFNHT